MYEENKDEEKQNEGQYVKAFELNFPYLCHLAAVLTHICDSCVH